jgi:enoyl-CoA hydratase/carnithine racemase
VVMGPEGYLSDPHVTFGMAATTAVQLTWPRRASEGVVREILMSGRKVGAEEAVSLGLANRLCAAGSELVTALDLAQAFAAMPRQGLAQTKRAFNRPLFAVLDDLLANG